MLVTRLEDPSPDECFEQTGVRPRPKLVAVDCDIRRSRVRICRPPKRGRVREIAVVPLSLRRLFVLCCRLAPIEGSLDRDYDLCGTLFLSASCSLLTPIYHSLILPCVHRRFGAGTRLNREAD